MNVSSTELSKKLYKLSGWHNTDYWWRLHKPNNLSKLYTVAEMDLDNYRFRGESEPNRRFREENTFYPAYDSGYLLRKLPESFEADGLHYIGDSIQPVFYPDMDITNDGFEFGYTNGGENMYTSTADTPEDALCKLAIRLFEEGVL